MRAITVFLSQSEWPALALYGSDRSLKAVSVNSWQDPEVLPSLWDSLCEARGSQQGGDTLVPVPSPTASLRECS